MSKLESIIVSFNCLDLLSITLPRNLPELDHIVIVTKPEDKKTIEYCRAFGDKITIFSTDIFTQDNAKFNKGAAISLAIIHYLRFKDYFCTQDTDVILNKGFKNNFWSYKPDPCKFYGMRRVNIDTREDFEALERGEKKLEDFICYRGSGFGYWSCTNYYAPTLRRIWKEWGQPYPYWIKEARDIDWMWRNEFGERIFDPPLGKFPECHLEPDNDYDTGLYTELPWRCIHLGMPGKNHEVRTTEKF